VTTTANSADSYILFTVAGTTYALSSEDVRRMEMVDQVTPVPNAAHYLEGVVLSRGQIVPVVNLRARFGFEKAPHDSRTRLLIVRSGERWVGLVADSAREFVTIPRTAIEPPGNAITGLSRDYLQGIANVGGRLVLVLDVNTVLDTSVVSGVPAPAGAVADTTPATRQTSV
jgi:purine-binding chemotaxis protein CheW